MCVHVCVLMLGGIVTKQKELDRCDAIVIFFPFISVPIFIRFFFISFFKVVFR